MTSTLHWLLPIVLVGVMSSAGRIASQAGQDSNLDSRTFILKGILVDGNGRALAKRVVTVSPIAVTQGVLVTPRAIVDAQRSSVMNPSTVTDAKGAFSIEVRRQLFEETPGCVVGCAGYRAGELAIGVSDVPSGSQRSTLRTVVIKYNVKAATVDVGRLTVRMPPVRDWLLNTPPGDLSVFFLWSAYPVGRGVSDPPMDTLQAAFEPAFLRGLREERYAVSLLGSAPYPRFGPAPGWEPIANEIERRGIFGQAEAKAFPLLVVVLKITHFSALVGSTGMESFYTKTPAIGGGCYLFAYSKGTLVGYESFPFNDNVVRLHSGREYILTPPAEWAATTARIVLDRIR